MLKYVYRSLFCIRIFTMVNMKKIKFHGFIFFLSILYIDRSAHGFRIVIVVPLLGVVVGCDPPSDL